MIQFSQTASIEHTCKVVPWSLTHVLNYNLKNVIHIWKFTFSGRVFVFSHFSPASILLRPLSMLNNKKPSHPGVPRMGRNASPYLTSSACGSISWMLEFRILLIQLGLPSPNTYTTHDQRSLSSRLCNDRSAFHYFVRFSTSLMIIHFSRQARR